MTSFAWTIEKSVVGWFPRMGNLIKSKDSLARENERLAREIRADEISLLLFDVIKRENEELKSILGRKIEGNLILAIVLVRPPVSPYDTLIIDRGKRDGLAVGNMVYAQGDVLIGEIAEIYDNRSKVTFFSTPGKKTNISFDNSNVRAEARGRGGGNFSASVPIDVEIKEGDIVIFSDIKPHIFGIVEKVIADSVDSFETILFRSPINIHDILFVEVKTSP
ncbi:MAG: rod shape-determining protein MreC [bacterium]|nr:rod shape-determining protein MreC [bacterium]